MNGLYASLFGVTLSTFGGPLRPCMRSPMLLRFIVRVAVLVKRAMSYGISYQTRQRLLPLSRVAPTTAQSVDGYSGTRCCPVSECGER